MKNITQPLFSYIPDDDCVYYKDYFKIELKDEKICKMKNVSLYDKNY